MHKLIAKYVQGYHEQQGSSTEKVKKILMRYYDAWDNAVSATIITDLIDDVNITGQDIVDYLADVYEFEGGNDEFHYAVRALQICLRKDELATLAPHDSEEDENFEEEDSDYDSELYNPKSDFISGLKY